MKKSYPVMLISGGSRGLGEALIRHFLSRSSYRVASFSRTRTPFVRSMEKRFKHFYYLEGDITAPGFIPNLMAGIQKRFGGLDILINNAAVVYEGVLPVMPEREIDRVLDINLKAAIHLTRAVTRLMIRKSGGSILNIASILGLRGSSGLSVYSASKAGLIGFTKSLARELGSRRIRVNAVAPGYFETEMSASLSSAQRAQIIRRTPLGRLGTLEDMVSVVDFLVSDRARFINGEVIVVDGGISC